MDLLKCQAFCIHEIAGIELKAGMSMFGQRGQLFSGLKNIINTPLLNRKNILLPPLHIKLSIMKLFYKALNKDNPCFEYLGKKFPKLTSEKIEGGIFIDSQIRQFMANPEFKKTMEAREKRAWISFKSVVNGFLDNHNL